MNKLFDSGPVGPCAAPLRARKRSEHALDLRLVNIMSVSRFPHTKKIKFYQNPIETRAKGDCQIDKIAQIY